MTKQEADFIGSMNMCDEISNEAYKKIMCNCEVEESQPCEDCISRADTLDAIETWDKFGVNTEQKLIRWQDHYVPYVHLDDVRNAIANMPSVIPQQKVGRWIDVIDEKTEITETHHDECSNCGYHGWNEYSYCPNCGAKMEVEDENKTK